MEYPTYTHRFYKAINSDSVNPLRPTFNKNPLISELKEERFGAKLWIAFLLEIKG